MIERLVSEFEDDYSNKVHRTPNHRQEIRCSVCGKFYLVDQETFEQLAKLMKYDLDNQVLCNDCEREYQNTAFE